MTYLGSCACGFPVETCALAMCAHKSGSILSSTWGGIEADPDGIDAHAPGAKLDAGKVHADLLEDFGLALLEVAKVATFGAKKYSRGGWQHVDQGVIRYNAAKWRHALKGRYEEHDKESGLLHAAHEAWNVIAKLELMLREKGATC